MIDGWTEGDRLGFELGIIVGDVEGIDEGELVGLVDDGPCVGVDVGQLDTAAKEELVKFGLITA